MKRAKCAGRAPNKRADPKAQDLWFPDKGQSTNDGKIVCFTCSVRPECASYQERTKSKEGMWAGKIQKRDE